MGNREEKKGEEERGKAGMTQGEGRIGGKGQGEYKNGRKKAGRREEGKD